MYAANLNKQVVVTNNSVDVYLTKRERAHILRRTAKFFEENPERWARGSLSSKEEGSYCAIGAMWAVGAGLPDLSSMSYAFANKVISDETAKCVPGFVGPGSSFWKINDSPSYTPDVKTLCKYLRKMARHLEHGGN